MDLTDVSEFFNNTTFTDAYGGLSRFTGRLSTYDDNARDSLSTERRILDVAPGVTLPARRVVQLDDEAWLVGQMTPDYHGDKLQRQKFVLHRASGLAQVKTFGQALSGTSGQSLWAGRLWVKETKEPTESSGLYGNYEIFFAAGEDIRDPAWSTGSFLDGRENNVLVSLEGRWHLVRSTLSSAGGFLVAVADELPEPVLTTITFTTHVWDPVADTKVETPVSIAAVNLRWQSSFSYLASYSEKYESGDAQALVLKSAVTPTVGDKVTLKGYPFRVVNIFDQDPVWSLHLRHD